MRAQAGSRLPRPGAPPAGPQEPRRAAAMALPGPPGDAGSAAGPGRRRIIPEVVAVRVPGRDCDVVLGEEVWRCRLIRRAPLLVALTRSNGRMSTTGAEG